MGFYNIYFSLGSNLGNRSKHIFDAIDMMNTAFGCKYSSLSKIIETAPWGFKSSNRFLNCCVMYRIFLKTDAVASADSAETYPLIKQSLEILKKVKEIERALGRSLEEVVPGAPREYKDRVIDIDILFVGSERFETEELTIPHKNIKERNFVMIPLLEIAKPSLIASFPEIFE